MVPNTLMHRKIWVVRRGKLPISPITGHIAACNDPSTWTDYRTAEKAWWSNSSRYDGLSIAIGNGVVALDLDHCFDFRLTSFAQSIVKRVPTYAEFSMSGTGLHLIAMGTLPANRHSKKIEMYSHSKFIALTGYHMKGSRYDLTYCEAEVNALYAELFPQAPERVCRTSAPTNQSDEQILQKASRNEKFNELYREGDITRYGGDWSAADLALTSMLRHYGASPEQIDRLFRTSALLRPKWDARRNGYGTYGAMTIAKAISR